MDLFPRGIVPSQITPRIWVLGFATWQRRKTWQGFCCHNSLRSCPAFPLAFYHHAFLGLGCAPFITEEFLLSLLRSRSVPKRYPGLSLALLLGPEEVSDDEDDEGGETEETEESEESEGGGEEESEESDGADRRTYFYFVNAEIRFRQKHQYLRAFSSSRSMMAAASAVSSSSRLRSCSLASIADPSEDQMAEGTPVYGRTVHETYRIEHAGAKGGGVHDILHLQMQSVGVVWSVSPAGTEPIWRRGWRYGQVDIETRSAA
jgi:hypothetical protein